MKKINQLSIPTNARVIVISDIHGELELFKRLLTKVNFSEEDYLIINGDLCEKGRDSIGVVNYVMALQASNSNVHVTEGNCDSIVENLLVEDPRLIHYVLKRRSIIGEWAEKIGFEINEETDIKELKEILLEHFEKEITWLMELPTAIEMPSYIFVHAGIEDVEDWKDTERDAAIAIPTFLEKSHRADKYVIVGHWPVANYATNAPANNPIIDTHKKIIAIDGGNVIKPTGQLNAFIIETAATGDVFSNTYSDVFPTCEVQEDFRAEPKMMGAITYPHYEIIPIETGDSFTLCEQVGTNKHYYVKNEYVKHQEDGNYTVKTDVSCTHLHVNKGDIVSIVDDSCADYTLIKKDGKEGWVGKDILLNLLYTNH